MSKEKTTCENCRFWDEILDVVYEERRGLCRIYAPRLVIGTATPSAQAGSPQIALSIDQVHPHTSWDDWCGEGQAQGKN